MDDYADLLEKDSLKGKRKLQVNDIKDELRYPWLDLRVPMNPMPTNDEMFQYITGETDYSLYIGMKIGGKFSVYVMLLFFSSVKFIFTF